MAPSSAAQRTVLFLMLTSKVGEGPSTALFSQQAAARNGRGPAMAADGGATGDSDCRRRRARIARAARYAKYGIDGEHEIARKAHASASDVAGGAAELARRGHAAAAAAVGGAIELARQASAARVAANPLGSTGVAIQRGIGNAISAGRCAEMPACGAV